MGNVNRKESIDKSERKRADDAKKRSIDWLKKHAASTKIALDSARALTATVQADTDSPEAKLEKVGRSLDSLTVRFLALERAIRECTDIFSKSKVITTATPMPVQNTSNTVSPGLAITAPPSKAKEDNVQGRLLSSVYFILESAVQAAKAEKGNVLLYTGRVKDELQSVAVVGGKGEKGAKQQGPIRLAAASGVAGSVLTSNIAVNQLITNDKKDVPSMPTIPTLSSNPTPKTPVSKRPQGRSLLCFPIIFNASSEPVGVVQLINKNHGSDSFNSDDEHVALSVSKLLASLFTRYQIDWLSGPAFSPALLHQALPEQQSTMHKALPQQVVKHEHRRLIYRTNHSGQYVRQKMLSDSDTMPQLGACASLLEVDEYILNLEDCWRRSVGLNIDYEQEQGGKSHQLRSMREEAKKDKRLICNLQDSLSMRTAEFDGFKNQYQEVKKDLQVLLDVKDGKAPVSQLLDL